MPLGVLTGYSEVGKALRKQELNRKGQLGGLGQQLQEGEPGVQGAEAGEGVWVPRILGARSLHFQATQPHQGLCERQFLFPREESSSGGRGKTPSLSWRKFCSIVLSTWRETKQHEKKELETAISFSQLTKSTKRANFLSL